MTKVLRGRVKEAVLCWDSPEEAMEVVKWLEGQRIEVIIRPAFRKPSRRTHAYYRAAVVPHLARELGHTELEMHLALKRELIPENVERKNPKGRSTAYLSQQEFNAYLDGIVALAAELGISVPQPNEVEP